MAVNYEDERFQKVESQKNDALSDLEQTYTDMIDKSDKYYQDQIDASKDWADKQTELQNEQLAHTTNKIEQQKEQAHKDYLKEQSGSYVDWQKQSNAYGAEAEKMAAAGLTNTGYSETSQVNMYNTYQNRVAVAREAYSNAVLNYDNAIKDAQLQNSSILAEIAAKALEDQLKLSLEGFQYKNQLILDKTNKKLEVDQMYYSRWQDVLNQINTENALAEQKRQANLADARAKAQLAEEQRQFDAQMAYQKGQGSGQSQIIDTSGGISETVEEAPIKAEEVANLTWDKASIEALGYGNLPVSEVEKLASQGKLTITQKGDTLYVKKSPSWKRIEANFEKTFGFSPKYDWSPV